MSNAAPMAIDTGRQAPSLGFLYVLTLPVAAALANLSIDSLAGYSYTGWMWIGCLAAGALLPQAEIAFRSRVPFPWRRWLAWCGLVWISLAWCRPLGPRNVQDALQITMPVLVAVVQTLHNYRLICPGALLMRDAKVCEACVGCAVPWRSVVHGCYRGSRVATAVTAAMLATHRAAGTWHKAVDRYIALTEFAREKFITAGFPKDQIAVKPNCVCPDPGQGSGVGGFAVFAGRLVPEKGIGTLLAAWERLHGRLKLKILGDGPMADEVREAARCDAAIEWLGPRPVGEVLDLLGRASMLVLPSTWYEGFPKTIVEAYAKGTPVVASRLGAMAEVVRDRATGMHFQPGNPDDMAAKITQLLDQPAELARMRRLARDEYEQHYTAARNGESLEAVYERALNGRAEAPSPVTAAEPVGAAADAGLPVLTPAKVDLFGVQVTPTMYEETSDVVTS